MKPASREERRLSLVIKSVYSSMFSRLGFPETNRYIQPENHLNLEFLLFNNSKVSYRSMFIVSP